MSSSKDRTSGSERSRNRAEGQLPEVHAEPPFPPAGSRSDEETGGTYPVEKRKETPSDQTSKSKPSKWLVELYTLSWLIFFSILGTLARLGVEAITQYPSAPVTSRVLWANIGGSFIMGFLTQDQRLFRQPRTRSRKTISKTDHTSTSKTDPSEIQAEHLKFKKTIPLYIGLTTGFCGSFTSFSSFMRDAFLALTNDLQTPSPTTAFQPQPTAIHSRNGGFSFLALLAILILHPALSIVSLQVGAQFALLTTRITPRIPATLLHKFLNPFMVLTSLGCWLGISLALTISPPNPQSETAINWRTRALIPMLMSPPGCLLRYYLSKYMNGIRPSFPLGTFTANIFATIVLGMSWDLQHSKSARTGNACAVLYGVMEGFCGCLSTVSTWVVELDSLGPKRGWIYGGISSAVGLACMVCIMGGMGWTVGFMTPVCG